MDFSFRLPPFIGGENRLAFDHAEERKLVAMFGKRSCSVSRASLDAKCKMDR